MALPPATFFNLQLFTAAMWNANVRDNLTTLAGGGRIQPGLISVWSGAVLGIPSGWDACDGGGGRRDLRDRIPVVAGSSFAVGDTGGAVSDVPGPHLTHTVGQPDHPTHSISAPSHGGATIISTVAGSDAFVNDGAHTTQPSMSGAHGHANAALDGTPHSHGAGISLLPPYRAQAYMQKAASGLSLTTPITVTTSEVLSAAQFNADLRDNPNYLLALTMAVGTILMWSGTSSSIPSGWQLCDGTNGTPDLRSKFVIGAGSTYAVNATGGNLTQRLPAHGSHTVTQADDHGSHALVTPGNHATTAGIATGGSTFYGVDATASDVIGHAGFDVTAHGSHSSFGVNGHTAHDDLSIVPPFFALIYMQLMSLPSWASPRTWTTAETVQAAEFDTYIRDNENYLNAAQAPLGAIAWWAGSIGSIPAGWTAVPSYDSFIPGAGNSTDGFYVPLQTGGAPTVTPADHPAHTVTQPSTHPVHIVIEPPDHVANHQISLGGSNQGLLVTTVAHHFIHVWPIDAGVTPSNHTHAFDVDTGAAHSAHAAITTRPPYLALPLMERVS